MARLLSDADRSGKASNAALCRSISTSYYAAFSEVSSLIADTFSTDPQSPAWRRVFRGLNHGSFKKAKQAYSRLTKPQSVDPIAYVLDTMVSLHDRRQQADYDPRFVATQSAAEEALQDASAVFLFTDVYFEPGSENRLELVSLCLFPSERL